MGSKCEVGLDLCGEAGLEGEAGLDFNCCFEALPDAAFLLLGLAVELPAGEAEAVVVGMAMGSPSAPWSRPGPGDAAKDDSAAAFLGLGGLGLDDGGARDRISGRGGMTTADVAAEVDLSGEVPCMLEGVLACGEGAAPMADWGLEDTGPRESSEGRGGAGGSWALGGGLTMAALDFLAE